MVLRGHLKPIGVWVRGYQHFDYLSNMTIRNTEIMAQIDGQICGDTRHCSSDTGIAVLYLTDSGQVAYLALFLVLLWQKPKHIL